MKFILPFILLLFIVGCGLPKAVQTSTMVHSPAVQEKIIMKKNAYLNKNLNDTILDIANQLLSTKTSKMDPTKIILTSFVDLENFDKTSIFGKLLSESMFNELHVRKFIVTDFRGQDAVLVNEDGEFHITRDTEKLRDNIINIEYILVGTYTKFEDQTILINARILDSDSGKILSTARVVYQPRNCSTFNICDKNSYLYNTETDTVIITDSNSFDIVSDDNRNK